MKEADEFYPALWDKGWLSSFQVRNHNGNIEAFDIKQFDQIAYAMRPAIFGAAQAYKTTKDVRYKVQAEKLFKWFTGNNPAGINMYDAATGRGYDGISNAEFVNYNSGAESTVEALLALQMLHSINQN